MVRADNSYGLHQKTLSGDSSILIRRAPPEVFAYVSDYARDPTWRTGVSEMLHDPPGEIQLGAKTHERMTFAGIRMINVAEIVEFEPGRKTAFKTIGGPLAATAAEARAYLEDLPTLWARTSDAGRHAIAEAVFERIDVLGVTDYTFTLTNRAKAHGWDAAFGGGIVRVKEGRFGRGERS